MSVNTTPYAERLDRLRKELRALGVDGFLIPHADEYLGENVPPCAQRLKWISGFTGSAGCAIVLDNGAAVLSDGRYTIQLKQQVNPCCFTVGDSVATPVAAWLEMHAPGKIIGFDPRLHTAADVQKLHDKNITVKALARNPLDAIWDERPSAPAGTVSLFLEVYAGQGAKDKVEQVAAQINAAGAGAAVLTLPDSVAWLLNIRGADVANTPVALAQAIVRADGSVQLFIEARKVDMDVRAYLGNRVEVVAPEALEDELAALAHNGMPVWLDDTRSPYWFKTVLEAAGAPLLLRKDPCIAPRATKNEAEQQAMKNAHVRDGVAMVKFLSWLEDEAPRGQQSELSVEQTLSDIRAEAREYKGASFDTIAGFGPHGAIVHYRATVETNALITAPGLLLVDSGGQYEDGTTDITRTVAVGLPSEEMKYHYTLVLKGHIALARARFPAGTTGAQIDALARAPLWQAGLDYAHGTGHGVGCYLSVHEEAASISTRGKDPLEAGMILSNEPGYYREGHYGIRIENLVLVVEAGECPDSGRPLLGFETITLCPYDSRLIEVSLLDSEEKQWLTQYGRQVEQALAPHLNEGVAHWMGRHINEKLFT